MKITTIGIVIMGVLVLLVSLIQWFFLYPDLSQFLFGFGLGVVICVLAYIYEWMKLKDKEIRNLNYRMDCMQYPSKNE